MLPILVRALAILATFHGDPIAPVRMPASPPARALANPQTTIAITAATSATSGTASESTDRRLGVAVSVPLSRTAAPPMRASPPPPPRDPVAQRLVTAALRQAGLLGGPADFDATATRARTAALLPELHLRVLSTDSDYLGATTTEDVGVVPQSSARTTRRLWLEAKAIFRLDRVLYSDDEPSLLRLRADAVDARSRITSHVLALYFQWRRARHDASAAGEGTTELDDAELRAEEASAALDVITGGAFHATTPPSAQ